ncbi:sulfotransferase family protein [Roseovarius rhodophyticola]|uniref:Sulfotransferase n=1 Tax=Roseovarius rhodophyticola TaxID=3080827 RepID=A0ABZ2TD00_9RHOB|nr:sulfotransferase [Roseovarius sp. W115]MDV2931269.1 sulfotransferase [Roseovarius sp. W115]
MTHYYHVDPLTTAGDASGRYPGNHVKYSKLLAPVRWIDNTKKALTGSSAFNLTKASLKEFDKPGDLHPRWGSANDIRVLRDCLEMFATGLDNNPHISSIGRMLIKTVYLTYLRNRTEFIEFFEENAEFIEANGKYKAPLLVTGYPRTGTTLLHRLLAEDPQSRSPYTYEMEQVLPPLKSGEDPMISDRIKKSAASINLLAKYAPGFIQKLNESHLWSATEKEESLLYMQFHHGMNIANGVQAGLEYALRLAQPDVAPALLKYERNFFTMLDAYAPAGTHWINKAPSYALYFGSIFDEFDDARVVVTHRNPAKNAASFARLVESACIPFDVEGSIDKHAFGQMVVEFSGLCWQRPLEFRNAHPERESQIIDAVYSDTFADPIAMVRRIYEKFEMEVTSEFEERMKVYLADNQQGKYGRHRYSNEEYAINAEDLKARHRDYFEKYGFDTQPTHDD